MRLVKSVLILQTTDAVSMTGQVVLVVKHPEDVDPVARMRVAAGDYMTAQRGSGTADELAHFAWSDALRRLSAGDWADHELRVDCLHPRAVIGDDENLLGLQGAAAEMPAVSHNPAGRVASRHAS